MLTRKKVNKEIIIILMTSIIFCIIISVLMTIKYYTFNTNVMDLGIFDYNIWNISKGDFSKLFLGHFQPILLVYGLLYKLWPSPLLLIYCQVIAIVSSVIPLYKLVKLKNNNAELAVLICAVFIFNGAVLYNAMFDFHTDHLFIPLLLWAYYYLKTNNRNLVIIALIIASLIKEPLLLTLAFFGVFTALVEKKFILGIGLFVIETALFLIIVICVIPAYSGTVNYGTAGSPAYAYLGNNINEIIRNIFLHPLLWTGKIINPGKIKFIFFLLAPLGGVLILRPLSLIPIIPTLGIAMLSQLSNYYDFRTQYTASMVPFLFIALINSITYIKTNFPKAYPYAIRFLILCSFAMGLMINPLPVSAPFWSNQYKSTYYYYTKYINYSNNKILKQAIDLIPANASLAIQNNINDSKLMHRTKISLLGDLNIEADYVLIDTKREHYFVDRVDDNEYWNFVHQLDHLYQIQFNKDGIELYKKYKVTDNL